MVLGTVTVGGARVATPPASVTAVPIRIGPLTALAVKVTVMPGIGALVAAFLSVAFMVWMTKVPLSRSRICRGAAVRVVATLVALMTTEPVDAPKHGAPL